jgi:hypothetical protein
MLGFRVTRIDLVLTDDWELRGDGSGHMPALQFDTMDRLMAIYERHGLRGTFTVEVLQQLRHLEEGQRHPALLDLARRWEDRVRDAYRRGHDIQMHLHPQWHGARREGDRWTLSAPWSITQHPPDQLRGMLREGRDYLESLLRPIEPHYRCVAFRGGSWSIAPGEHVLPALIDNGILLDVSLVGGLHYDNPMVRLDYRNLEEEFLPFYPDLHDARRLARGPQPIVCLPTHSFDYTPAAKLRHLMWRRATRLPGAGRLLGGDDVWKTPDSAPVDGDGPESPALWNRPPAPPSPAEASRLQRLMLYYRARQRKISNLSSLSYPMMREMVRDIRKRAAASGWPAVPVVLENHTKHVGRFDPIERFAAYIIRQMDVRIVPLGRVAHDLAAGFYPIRARAA